MSQPVSASQTISSGQKCVHCGTVSPNRFCCSGCELVYQVIQESGLSDYYRLRKSGPLIRSASPVSLITSSYSYLDHQDFKKSYCQGQRMEFYLEGVHCAACAWLVEKLPSLVDGVSEARLDLGRSVATLTLKPNGEFAEAAKKLHELGYRPHPIRQGEEEQMRKREARSNLIRIAVAGACAGNIMLLAVSLYAGVDGTLAQVFRWLSLAIYLPVALYSAAPFYQSALTAVRTRSLSIDIPLVLGIIAGSIASVVNLFQPHGHIYFDSLAALIFLLLASRHVLKQAQMSALRTSGLAQFLRPSSLRKQIGDETWEEVSIDAIQNGDIVQIRADEPIPVDGTIVRGKSYVNCALMTGEPDWIAVGPGDVVVAGTTNHRSVLDIQVSASGNSTRLGKILQSVEDALTHKTPITEITDRMAKVFTFGISISAVGLALSGIWLGWDQSLNRALALVIVTCPCGLALATPLALVQSISRAARRGILIKGSDVLERISRAKRILLDKTGTLTEGSFEVLSWSGPASRDPFLASVVIALESRSNHPIARALTDHLKRTFALSPALQLDDFEETPGLGVSGVFGGIRYSAQRPETTAAMAARTTCVEIRRDGALIARAELGDRLRADTPDAVRKIREAGVTPWLVSGDQPIPVLAAAEAAGIPAEYAISRATPEQKGRLADSQPDTLMVGDGANDAVALSSASVGIAVHGGMEISLRAADVYLSQPGVMPVAELITISRETMKVIRRNIIFSLFYNVIGASGAALGWITPLGAAILMPASALTVLISSLSGTRRLRK